jgi:2-haloacid dehalogenase
MPQTNAHGTYRKPSVLVFDVNETLIDIEWMNPVFEHKRVVREWFNHLIMYSMTITLSNLYKDFWTLVLACSRWSAASTTSISSRKTSKH